MAFPVGAVIRMWRNWQEAYGTNVDYGGFRVEIKNRERQQKEQEKLERKFFEINNELYKYGYTFEEVDYMFFKIKDNVEIGNYNNEEIERLNNDKRLYKIVKKMIKYSIAKHDPELCINFNRNHLGNSINRDENLRYNDTNVKRKVLKIK